MAGKTTDAFMRLAASDYARARLTDPLYRALRNMFGFVAHFNRDGFHEVRFGDWAARVLTLSQIAEYDAHPLSDAERELRELVVGRHLLDEAVKALAAETEKRERAELARLKEKYGS